jgi:hypothetical protein
MGIKSVKWVMIVACLGLAGCGSQKAGPQPATGRTAAPNTGQGVAAVSASTAPEPNEPKPAPVKAAGGATTVPPTKAEAEKAPPAVEPAPEPKRPDVVFVPTPPEVVAKMLELAKVTKDDVVYDLGCGDGRIVVAAAKLGCRAYGFDVDPRRIKESQENVLENGVGRLATIAQKDIFTLDLSKASVVTLYLLPSLNVKLIPQLEKLQPGSRIVSHDFDMKGVTPDQVVEVNGEGGYRHRVYLWTAPLKKEAPAPQ